MPTAAVLQRRRELEDEAHNALDILRKANVWMTAWAIAHELGYAEGRQSRNAIERLVKLGHVEVRDTLASTQGFGRHYHATT